MPNYKLEEALKKKQDIVPTIHQVEVQRLTPRAYKDLERSLPKVDTRVTDAGTLGIQVGMEIVLRALREGYVVS